MNIKLTLEYRGTNFLGWQKQPGIFTIEKNIEEALGTYFKSCLKKQQIEIENSTTKIHASGRTDAGVHSLGQVVNFEWPKYLAYEPVRFLKSINSLTHEDISVLKSELTSDQFHARKSAKNKTYIYNILLRESPPTFERGLVWHIRKLENISEMFQCSSLFCGEHDFKSFRASDCNSTSTVRSVFHSEFTSIDEHRIRYTINGSGFLKHQVRFILAALIALGENRISRNDIKEMLAGKERPPFKIAPSYGLFLESVQYE